MTAIASLAVAVTVSLTVTAAPVYLDARCPSCARLVMAVPAPALLEVRTVANNAARSGRGRVVSCPRCRTLVEVVEHRR